MLHYSRTNRRTSRKPKPRRYQSLQKPNGVISPRVQKVGGERFAIVCVDPDGEIVYWNRGAEVLYGYRPGEILGQSVQKLVPKQEAENDNE